MSKFPPGACDVMKQKYPEVSVGALILNKGELFLVKSWKWGDRFTIPGGHVELGEKMEDAVRREVKEEVGINLSDVKFHYVQEGIYSKEFFKPKHFIFLDFICKTKSSKCKLDKDEIQECIWVKPENALNLNIDSFTRNSIKKYLETKGVRKWK